MRNVDLQNEIQGCDNLQLSYNHEIRNFDHLIGAVVRDGNYFVIGKVVEIDYSRDGYSHDNVFAVLDTGKRINCRKFS